MIYKVQAESAPTPPSNRVVFFHVDWLGSTGFCLRDRQIFFEDGFQNNFAIPRLDRVSVAVENTFSYQLNIKYLNI